MDGRGRAGALDIHSHLNRLAAQREGRPGRRVFCMDEALSAVRREASARPPQLIEQPGQGLGRVGVLGCSSDWMGSMQEPGRHETWVMPARWRSASQLSLSNKIREEPLDFSLVKVSSRYWNALSDGPS